MYRMHVATYMAKHTLINVYPLFCNEGKILVFISYYYFYFYYWWLMVDWLVFPI